MLSRNIVSFQIRWGWRVNPIMGTDFNMFCMPDGPELSCRLPPEQIRAFSRGFSVLGHGNVCGYTPKTVPLIGLLLRNAKYVLATRYWQAQ